MEPEINSEEDLRKHRTIFERLIPRMVKRKMRARKGESNSQPSKAHRCLFTHSDNGSQSYKFLFIVFQIRDQIFAKIEETTAAAEEHSEEGKEDEEGGGTAPKRGDLLLIVHTNYEGDALWWWKTYSFITQSLHFLRAAIVGKSKIQTFLGGLSEIFWKYCVGTGCFCSFWSDLSSIYYDIFFLKLPFLSVLPPENICLHTF